MRDWIQSNREIAGVAALVVAFIVVLGVVALAGTFLLGIGQNVQSDSYGAAGGAADGGGESPAAVLYGTDERVVVRDASMEVQVEEYEPAFAETETIAERHGGFVASWDRDRQGEWDRATVTLRVPAENFSDARSDLADLGTVRSENVETTDRTGEFVSREARLEALRQERQRLQSLLSEATTTDDKLDVSDRLRDVDQRIRQLESDQGQLRRDATFSTITVTLREPPGRKPPENYQTAFGFTDAFLGAFYGGLEVTKGAIVVIGYAIPVGLAGVLLGGFAVVCYRLWARLKTRIDAVLAVDAGG